MLKIFLLLILLFRSSALAAGGWLFWEMDGLIKTPLNEKTVISAKAILSKIPLYTDKAQGRKNYGIDFIFSAKQGEIDEIMAKLNWHKLSTNFKKSFFLTVKDLVSGNNSTHFPPAAKHYLNKKIQDLSYGKIIKHRRIEFYIWRLPYRTADYIPLWAAAYSNKIERQSGGVAAWQRGKKVAGDLIAENNNAAKRQNESDTKQPSQIIESKLYTQTAFISSLRKLSSLKITELRHPNRDKNILLIKTKK
ncbi:MAG: LssY C-terminal domain-containing protein [Elusimicrobia bacterium]|nr:LssY C-terminal domain-containing protein [Elusimicrobiota bacterium]